jgi:hypothetical protein
VLSSFTRIISCFQTVDILLCIALPFFVLLVILLGDFMQQLALNRRPARRVPRLHPLFTAYIPRKSCLPNATPHEQRSAIAECLLAAIADASR